jgi:broad specificity phosphatase PhoE
MPALICTFMLMVGFSSSTVHSADYTVQPHEDFTRIIVLRHAPKANMPKKENAAVYPPSEMSRKDPPLNSVGTAKAQAYTELSDLYNISGIYSTNLRRTKDTVMPLSEKIGVKIDTTIKPFDYQAQLKSILDHHLNKTVVIVGHSNTVPGFINYLLPAEQMPDLAHDAYSDIFILKYYSTKQIELIKLRHAVKTTHRLLIKD